MVSVGYGDVVPKTKIEKLITIAFTFVNCALFAYTVNVMGSIFTENIKKTKKIKKLKYLVS